MSKILFLVNTDEPHPERHGYSTFHQTVERWAQAKHITVDTLSLSELVFTLDDSKMNVISAFTGKHVGDYDLVVFKNVRDYLSTAREVAHYLEYANIPYVDARVQPMINSKHSSQVIYSKIGLPYIPSHYGYGAALLEAIKKDRITLEYPVVVKDAQGSKGANNFLVKSARELMDVLQKHPEIEWIIQPFIPNDCDYRITIFGSKAAVVVKRTRKSSANTHLNNIAKGARGELVDPMDLPEKMISDAVAAAAAEQLQVAGVDIIVNKETGEHYIMEVNGSPALAVGVFTEEHMAAYTSYLEQLLERAKTSLK